MTDNQKKQLVIKKALKYAYSNKIDALDMISYLSRYSKKYEDTKYNKAIVEWYEFAINNDANVAWIIGDWLLDDEISKALKLIHKAANKQGKSANAYLGDCYFFGEYGLKKSNKKALFYYIRGCKYGSRQACRSVYWLLNKLCGKKKALKVIDKKIGYELFIVTYLGIRDFVNFLKKLPRRIIQKLRYYYLVIKEQNSRWWK